MHSIQIQPNKLDKYCEWAQMDLGSQNAQSLDAPIVQKTKLALFKTHIQTKKIFNIETNHYPFDTKMSPTYI